MRDEKGVTSIPDPTPLWQQACIRQGASVFNVDYSLPAQPRGWVVLVKSGTDESELIQQASGALAAAGVGALLVDLEQLQAEGAAKNLADLASRLRVVTRWLKSWPERGELPLACFCIGKGTAVALQAAIARSPVTALLSWNGLPELAWRKLDRASAPALFLVSDGAGWRRYAFNWLAQQRILMAGGRAELQRVPAGVSPVETYLQSWLLRRLQAPAAGRFVSLPVTPAGRTSLAQKLATGGVLLAFGLSSSGAAAVASTQIAAAQSPAASSADPFEAGVKLDASQVRGDGEGGVKKAGEKKSTSRSTPAYYSLGAGDVAGDGVLGPNGTGGKNLVDANGLKWFINTNITFSTSSSASAAMSEASFTHSVTATTLNGGTAMARLNDAFDGYNTLCLSLNNTVATCETGNANFVIYNKNGTPTTECHGDASGVDRQVVFPVQTSGNVQMQRKVFVPDNDGFARWLNIFTNTGGTPQTVTMVIANNLGSDSNTRIVTTSDGDTSAETSDTWVTTFQNYSGTTSSDPRLGHILQGPGAPVGLAGINFADGDDNPFWGYTFVLQPGETRIVMNFAVGRESKAAAAGKAAELAGLPANALQCMNTDETNQVINFQVIKKIFLPLIIAPKKD